MHKVHNTRIRMLLNNPLHISLKFSAGITIKKQMKIKKNPSGTQMTHIPLVHFLEMQMV